MFPSDRSQRPVRMRSVCHDAGVDLPDIELESGTVKALKLGHHAVDVAGASAFVLLLTLLAFRLPRALDLSDESYYALFVDDWLKGGIRGSSYLCLLYTSDAADE